ncbi:MAG TPA: aminotransferase class I/II-fold pyridoxal phosphate-dependent enzyme, partial [Gammaproteobacteria bacterium]|nr:aminotransferase class I/II-fold pyridoxal phosphate-dependent enzyme [Gammaproteobacteria bacterium]
MDLELKDLINSGIKGLTPYEPGKPIEDLEREYGIKKAIKLASNESPLGPSPKVLEALKEVISGINRYPDGNGSRLKEALSSRHSLSADTLTLGNGSNDIIEFVARCFLTPNDNAVYSKHAFAVYPLVTQSLGAQGVEVEARDWGHDLQAMLDAVNNKTKVVFIANPNNPTGTFLEKNEIIRFLEKIPNEVIVLLDQAYFDYSNYETEDVPFSLVNNFPNLIISRTFSKAYGLAGLRVGFSVTS